MIKNNKRFWRELRCKECRKLFCYEYVYNGRIKWKCTRCKTENTQVFKTPKRIMEEIQKQGENRYNNSINLNNNKGVNN